MNESILHYEANLSEKSKEYLDSPECAELDAKIEHMAKDQEKRSQEMGK